MNHRHPTAEQISKTLSNMIVDPTYNKEFFEKLFLDCLRPGHTDYEVRTIEFLLEKKVVNPSIDSNRVIRWATEYGQLKIIELIAINTQDRDINFGIDRNRPLQNAVLNGYTNIVKLLLTRNDVNVSDRDNSFVKLAYEKGHTEIVKALIPRIDLITIYDVGIHSYVYHPDISCRPSKDQVLSTLQKLFENSKFDKQFFNMMFRSYMTESRYYTSYAPEIIEILLLHKKVDVNIDNSHVVIWASENYEGRKIMELLTKEPHTLDFTVKNNIALNSAVRRNNAIIVKLLLTRIPTEYVDSEHITYAFGQGWYDIVKLLIPRTDMSKISDIRIHVLAQGQ